MEKTPRRPLPEGPRIQTTASRFLERLGEVRRMVRALDLAAQDHYGVDPDTLNWGHVGDMGRIADQLQAIFDSRADLAAYLTQANKESGR